MMALGQAVGIAAALAAAADITPRSLDRKTLQHAPSVPATTWAMRSA